MKPKIALFASHHNAQAAEIAQAVAAEGATPLVFDIQVGGQHANRLAVSGDRASWAGTDFSDIRAIHIRGTAPRTLPAVPAVMNPASFAEMRARFLREQEFQGATYAFFESQARRGKLVVNPLSGAYVDHNSKSQFYDKLAAAGFPVPRSLSTNCPETAARFIAEVGEAVAKPAIGVGSTRIVEPADLERLDELRACPVLLQERLRGDTVRVHVVADTVVLALRIITEGGVDSRTGRQEFEYLRLTDEEEARIVRANRFLGLHYAAWDVIVDGRGEAKYLDCNPGPYVMWIGPEFRAAVFRQLAVYMVGFALSGSLEEASSRVVAWRE